MDFRKLVPLDQVLDKRLEDPEFRAHWDKTAFAREVALRILRYRTDHDLSQTDLARMVGMHQPAIARLEAGDHTPTVDTLARITTATGLEFHVNFHHGTATLVAA